MIEVPRKILIMQTAFLGDVILATSVAESLHAEYPDSEIHFLVRKGNESLLPGHPFLKKVWVLDKKDKVNNVWRMIRSLRLAHFDLVINLQRFLSSGIVAAFSGGKVIRGFRKNPMSFLFSSSFSHTIETTGGKHEIERNHVLIEDLVKEPPLPPRLYPQPDHLAELKALNIQSPFICIAPASIWFTKQWPASKWISFLNAITQSYNVYLLGAPGDFDVAEGILQGIQNPHITIYNLAGKLSLLASAALMKQSVMNFVNDSAPLHLASAVDAPVTAVFCSTVPAFGFTPLSTDSEVVECDTPLPCRPCGLHGHRACPEGHFKCALNIDEGKLLIRI
jgi:ADP-heptose:LPS heptosyltransferase